MIIFTILYLFLGIEVEEETIRLTIPLLFSTDFKTILGYINEAFSLSVGMFAAVGYTNAKPIPVTYMVANIEILLGVIMVGIGIASLIKKAKDN